MQAQTFTARTAAQALAQIRETLGPDAVVLNVRRPPVAGLAGLWQKPGLEVIAHVPDEPTLAIQPEMMAELREKLREIRRKNDGPQAGLAETPRAVETVSRGDSAVGQGTCAGKESAPPTRQQPDSVAQVTAGNWRVGTLLESSGLLPLHAQSVVEELRALHGDDPPKSFGREFELARKMLLDRWNKPVARQSAHADVHVFIGPPGAGKTTSLCKWLAQTVLVEARPASVWRLDGHVANTAESLNLFCEILGVPMERFPPTGLAPDNGVLFIDLPGVNPADSAGLSALNAQLSQLPSPQVHLVLNAAYETSLLLAQVRAFAPLPIGDLIATHLDEERRWGKLWNLVLGTNYSLRFLSAGQNIPGEFTPALPEKILARQFQRK